MISKLQFHLIRTRLIVDEGLWRHDFWRGRKKWHVYSTDLYCRRDDIRYRDKSRLAVNRLSRMHVIGHP